MILKILGPFTLLYIILVPASWVFGWGICSDVSCEAIMSEDGNYVIGIYWDDSPDVVIWDTRRLWDFIQPVQVHQFALSTKVPKLRANRNIVVSVDGTRLAYALPGEIRVCKMGDDFPCDQIPLPRTDNATPILSLSPDGSILLILEPDRLQSIDLNNNQEVLAERKGKWNDYMLVHWDHERVALGSSHIEILNLKTLKTEHQVKTIESSRRPIAFSPDGEHLIVPDGTTALIYAIGDSSTDYATIRTVKVNSSVLGNPSKTLWYLSPTSSPEEKEQSLMRAGPSGEPVPNSIITIRKGPRGQIAGISPDYVLVERPISCGSLFLLVSSRTGLPMFELFRSRVNAYGRYRSIRHLLPRLGATPLIEMLERQSTEYEVSDERGFSFNDKRPEILLWIAAIVTRRQQRYDPVWFDLLSTNQKGKDTKSLGLISLSAAIVSLNQSESLAKTGKWHLAVVTAQECIQRYGNVLRQASDGASVDWEKPSIEALVPRYWSVVERELRLVEGAGLTALGRLEEAENTYREILRQEPSEWRAYAGLLQAKLGEDDAQFTSLVEEANMALRLESWTDKPGSGYREPFFDLSALKQLRERARTP